jgi:DNA-binding NtrC family response regulator
MRPLRIHAVRDGQTAVVWQLAKGEGPRDVGSSLRADWTLDHCPDLLCRLEVIGEGGDSLAVTELGEAAIRVNGVAVGFRVELTNGKRPCCSVGEWELVVTADPPDEDEALQAAALAKAASTAAPTAGTADIRPPDRSIALKISRERSVEIIEATPGLQLGRDESCGCSFTHAHVSRIHACLEDSPEGIRIRDLGSLHHTYLGSTKLLKGMSAVLEPGAVVELSRAFGAPRLEVLARKDVEVEKARLAAGASLAGDSPEFQEQIEAAMGFAAGRGPIGILGERGTGKSALAAAIAHRVRAGKPFVTADCGSIPETLIESELNGHVKGAFTGATSRKGLFQEADGGVIFLDEFAEVPLRLQPRLLRVLNDGVIRPVGSEKDVPVDVFVIVATNRDPEELKDPAVLRPDLLDRLGKNFVRMLSLREHKSDIPAIANAHLAALAARSGIRRMLLSEDAEALLLSLDWPGNVRDMLKVVEAAALKGRGRYLEAEAIHAVRKQMEKAFARPPVIVRQASPAAESAERAIVEEALRRLDGKPFSDAQGAGQALERAIVEAAIQRSGGKWRQTLWAELGYESKNALHRRLTKWGLL